MNLSIAISGEWLSEYVEAMRPHLGFDACLLPDTNAAPALLVVDAHPAMDGLAGCQAAGVVKSCRYHAPPLLSAQDLHRDHHVGVVADAELEVAIVPAVIHSLGRRQFRLVPLLVAGMTKRSGRMQMARARGRTVTRRQYLVQQDRFT